MANIACCLVSTIQVTLETTRKLKGRSHKDLEFIIQVTHRFWDS